MHVPAGAIELDADTCDLLGGGRSHEILRAWITDNGPATIIINACTIPPSMFGMLLADCARHAALAYAAADGTLSERTAREQILGSLWQELADPTTPLETITPGGREN
jgi:5,10-methenyltetrahydromethanopterin hydrogenase